VACRHAFILDMARDEVPREWWYHRLLIRTCDKASIGVAAGMVLALGASLVGHAPPAQPAIAARGQQPACMQQPAHVRLHVSPTACSLARLPQVSPLVCPKAHWGLPPEEQEAAECPHWMEVVFDYTLQLLGVLSGLICVEVITTRARVGGVRAGHGTGGCRQRAANSGPQTQGSPDAPEGCEVIADDDCQ